MSKVALVYDDVFLLHQPPELHPERPERLVWATEALGRYGPVSYTHLTLPTKA